MASRYSQQKPDPEIKANVRRARAGLKNKKDLRGLVAGASVAITMTAWALFSGHDAQAAAAAQTGNGSRQASVGFTLPEINLDFSWLGDIVNGSQDPSGAQVSGASAFSFSPPPFTSTSSSR